jgi:release factor glutamine methyltransferase
MAPLDGAERFDLITANPPYIAHSEIAALDAGIREFEPRLALDGGDDGLELLRRIVAGAPARLRPGGILALEIGHNQANRVAELFEQARFSSIQRRKDYGGHERVLSGQR